MKNDRVMSNPKKSPDFFSGFLEFLGIEWPIWV